MQIDQKTLNRLLAMNDEQLGDVIKTIAKEAGIAPESLGLNPENIAGIRAALGSATQADLEQLNTVYDAYRRNRKKR